MASTRQRAAAKKNIKKAAVAAKQERTIAHLPKAMEAVELYSNGGDPKMSTGVPLEKAKEFIDKQIEEEIKKLERLIPWVNDREKQLLERDEVRSLIPPQVASDHLTRIETHLARQIDRTLSQLERLQRMRLGQPVMPRLDVHVSS